MDDPSVLLGFLAYSVVLSIVVITGLEVTYHRGRRAGYKEARDNLLAENYLTAELAIRDEQP